MKIAVSPTKEAPHSSVRLVYYAQVVLNLALLGTGIWLATGGHWRARYLLLMVPLVFAPFSYARVRFQRLLARHSARSVAWSCAVVGIACDTIMAAQLVTARQANAVAWLQAPGINWIGSVWFSAFALLLLAYGVKGLLRLGRRPVRRVSSGRPAIRSDEVQLDRREFLQRASLFGAAVPFGVSLSGVPLSYDFRIEQREITLPHWPPALDGLRVVHLSDIHVGGAMDRDRLLRVAELTNQCRGDIVLHTGDFLTHRSGNFDEPLYEALAQIRAAHGQWACFGNHDYDNAQRLQQRLHESGVSVLRSATQRLLVRGTALEVSGIDFVFGRLDRSEQFQKIVRSWGPRAGTPRLLLNHDPSGFDQLPNDCADLVLSGHTHGGHLGIQLTRSQAITVVGLVGIPDQGLFERDDMRLYVTRCVGFYGYPMRIGIPPEIALLILRSPRAQITDLQNTDAQITDKGA